MSTNISLISHDYNNVKVKIMPRTECSTMSYETIACFMVKETPYRFYCKPKRQWKSHYRKSHNIFHNSICEKQHSKVTALQ